MELERRRRGLSVLRDAGAHPRRDVLGRVPLVVDVLRVHVVGCLLVSGHRHRPHEFVRVDVEQRAQRGPRLVRVSLLHDLERVVVAHDGLVERHPEEEAVLAHRPLRFV